jgi:hypothetical protein
MRKLPVFNHVPVWLAHLSGPTDRRLVNLLQEIGAEACYPGVKIVARARKLATNLREEGWGGGTPVLLRHRGVLPLLRRASHSAVAAYPSIRGVIIN